MNLNKYLKYLNEQKFGSQPPKPVQNPRAGLSTSIKRLQPKVPKQPKIPQAPTESVLHPGYFNYLVWTSKIVKQGEIFRNNCNSEQCGQFEVGTGDRRICKKRCEIEACKKVIALLKASADKCKDSMTPDKCKQRYFQLIPLYQNRLNKLSKKFIESEKVQKQASIKVG